jgi:alcohol dehydrogenase class IV
MMKFSLCALAVIIALVATVGCNTDTSQLAPKPVTLNADEYRQEIAEIDRLLFSPKAYDESRREKLAGNLEALASKITAASNSRFLKMEASEIRTLASLAKHTSASTPRDSLENNWMRIRNNLFEDRYWMARSAADLESP